MTLAAISPPIPPTLLPISTMGEWAYLHITNPGAFLKALDEPSPSELNMIHLQREADHLRPRWTTLYKETLPALARAKDPVQPHWPVHLDHCFARIIYDAVIGLSRNPDSAISGPWTDRLEAPAVKNMHAQNLKECIALGEEIAAGKVDLVELDRLSLAVRGKLPKGGKRGKRKREGGDEKTAQDDKRYKITETTTSSKPAPRASHQPDIRSALGAPPPPPPTQQQPPPTPLTPTLTTLITTHATLTPFRKRVLLALCQVPAGQWTTYLALSTHLHSSPRAVGNALRNNPFAPRVPCHRVVAADGGIGGFGGEWGVGGRHCGEKVRLLRGEGVGVGGDGSRVMGRVWEGFV